MEAILDAIITTHEENIEEVCKNTSGEGNEYRDVRANDRVRKGYNC